jgi:hypothetical protein
MVNSTKAISIDAFRRERLDDRLHLAKEVLLPAAEDRDRWAALSVINTCADAVRDGCALPQSVAVWLAEILTRISEGDSIEEACGIPVRGRGAKKEGLARANASGQYMMAYHFGVRHEHEGVKALAAQKEIADLFHKSIETVRAAWKKHKLEVMREIALEVECFGAPWPTRYRAKGYRDRDLITSEFAG